MTTLGLSSCASKHHHIDAAVAPFTAQAADTIHIAWQREVDFRRPATISGFSQPVVAGSYIVIGGQDRRVRIFTMDGDELNRVALAAPCESSGLQLANGLVVVGDIDGMLYGIDPDQAKIVWKTHLGAPLISAPVALQHGFIVQVSNNQVYRFDDNGKKVWSYSGLLGGLSMRQTPAPVVYDGKVYVALSNSDVVALKASNGTFLWKHQLLINTDFSVLSEMKVPSSTPTLVTTSSSGAAEDMLVVALFQGDIDFLSLSDGSTLHRRHISLKSSALLHDKRLFVADTEGFIRALDASSSDILWKQHLSSGALSGPVLWHNKLWVADDRGYVFRLTLDGGIEAVVKLKGRIDRAPVVTPKGVLVRNNLGTLYLLTTS